MIMKAHINYKLKNIVLSIITCFVLFACEEFTEVDQPKGQIPKDLVFEDESTATSAVTSIYAKLRDDTLLTGNLYGLGVLMGFYTDEMEYYADTNTGIYPFYSHEITADNDVVKALWDGSYQTIYMTNLVIEGLENSTSLSPETKQQLRGEVLFLRALVHFYLLNLFNDIPYVVTTDYLINQDVSRSSMEEVYSYILTDLLEAKEILSETYVGAERIRANKFVVSALLSRVYLYMGYWENAISESSLVINNTGLYYLEPIENEFLKESGSAILQFKPKNSGDNTNEAISYYFIYGPPYFMSMSSTLISSFEPQDLRLHHWVRIVSDGSQNWYAPYKYREVENTGTSMEYSIVFRLAEMFLIRAEARLQIGDLTGSMADLNTIRNRAGLDEIIGASPLELSDAILMERNHELFTEFGHRWFDLKRFGMAESVLMDIKPNWQSRDAWLPIPELELLMNPNLLPQNTGY